MLSALANSPQAKILDALGEQLRAGTSDEVRQLFPLIDQLQPIFEDISNDRLEFSPTPEESRRMVQRRYGVSRNLLVRFLDDNIDETLDLSLTLQTRRGDFSTWPQLRPPAAASISSSLTCGVMIPA